MERENEIVCGLGGMIAGAVTGAINGAHIGIAAGPVGAIAGTIPCAVICVIHSWQKTVSDTLYIANKCLICHEIHTNTKQLSN